MEASEFAEISNKNIIQALADAGVPSLSLSGEQLARVFKKGSSSDSAVLYYKGTVALLVDKDPESAIRYFNAASIPESEYLLAKIYLKREDFKKTVMHFEAAAQRGFARAANDLGHYFHHAKTEPNATVLAEKYYRLAISLGPSNAAFNLGVLLLELERVEEAEAQFRSGAEAGNLNCARHLDRLLSRNSASQC